MARTRAVWGIDIGQCALKALRCRAGDEPGEIVAEAFDYIEYPKLLSQPEANAEELIAEALTQFLSRNSLRGDRVAISVSGQSGLARFIKLPPVEAKKIPDIVKYEARQQIPFALEDVVWDYQRMAGGSEEEGFALETEVGLFAMKRDQVLRALAPFDAAGIEVDFIQLAPLALYNFAAFDQMRDLPPPEEYDPENPPPSTVILSLGTDTTDLVVTNGYRVWQRSVPLGGNHFTRALTKELKLTFAKAEHMKRNAAQADDPKAVFQAMRPVFNDLLTEVQRSISFFNNLDRRAKIGRVLAMGNAMRLPGLQRYLAQNLGHEVIRLETFNGLTGSEVLQAPAFKENILSFPIVYGLALQGLADTKIKTNLVPPELVKARLIRSKKPWAVGAAAILLLCFTLNSFAHWGAWRTTRMTPDYFGGAKSEADNVVREAQGYQSAYDEAKNVFQQTKSIGENLTHSDQGRTTWLHLLKAIDAAVPRDPKALDVPLEEIQKREEIHVVQIESAKVGALETWATAVQQWIEPIPGLKPDAPAAPPAAAGEDGAAAEDGAADAAAAAPDAAPADAEQAVDPNAEPGAEGAAPAGAAGVPMPSGPGWVFQISGYHYHNPTGDTENEGAMYVRKTLMKNLVTQKLKIGDKELTMAEIGFGTPVLVAPKKIEQRPLQDMEGPQPAHMKGTAPPIVRRFDFIVQLPWKEPVPEGTPVAGAEEEIQ